MDATIWIIAYSKYSKMCDELFKMIEELSIPTPFQYLDIDNKKLRERIKKTKDFSIAYVPCIISINAVGVASQYEGVKAFEVVKLMQPPPPPLPPQHVPQRSMIDIPVMEDIVAPPPPIPPPTRETKDTGSVTLIENLVDEIPETAPKNPAIKGNKVSVNQIMKSAQALDEPKPKIPVPNFEQKKTGSKISVSEIMSQYE